MSFFFAPNFAFGRPHSAESFRLRGRIRIVLTDVRPSLANVGNIWSSPARFRLPRAPNIDLISNLGTGGTKFRLTPIWSETLDDPRS